MTKITIPKSVSNIGEYVFDGCQNLTNVYYTGTESDWNNIYISYGNNYLNNAARIYITETTKETKTTVYDDAFTVYPINIAIGNTVILAIYNGDRLVNVQSAKYNGKDIPFEKKEEYTSAKVMVWKNLNDFSPICPAENIDNTLSAN